MRPIRGWIASALSAGDGDGVCHTVLYGFCLARLQRHDLRTVGALAGACGRCGRLPGPGQPARPGQPRGRPHSYLRQAPAAGAGESTADPRLHPSGTKRRAPGRGRRHGDGGGDRGDGAGDRPGTEAGIGLVGVRRSTHYGMAAYYVLQAVAADCIGFAFTNSSPGMAPFGGTAADPGREPAWPWGFRPAAGLPSSSTWP